MVENEATHKKGAHFVQAALAQTKYHAYLVRIWRDDDDATWRASAQSTQTGAVIRFATLSALFAYVNEQTERRLDGE